MENETVVQPKQKRKYTRRKPVTPKLKPEPETQEWDLSIQIPTRRLRDVFAAFTTQEQADAIAVVLQRRLDVILESA